LVTAQKENRTVLAMNFSAPYKTLTSQKLNLCLFSVAESQGSNSDDQRVAGACKLIFHLTDFEYFMPVAKS
jgi:hypothetical protein